MIAPRILLPFLALAITATAAAQTLPNAPQKPPAPLINAGSYNYLFAAGSVCGGGASYASPVTKPTAQCGILFIWPFFELEGGVMGPQASHSAVSAYLTTNFWTQIGPQTNHGVPLATAGYTRMFETGNAFDYGLGYAYPVDKSHSIRFEARDYYTFSGASQHNVILRVSWLVGLAD
jgi:hypothetical protein